MTRKTRSLWLAPLLLEYLPAALLECLDQGNRTRLAGLLARLRRHAQWFQRRLAFRVLSVFRRFVHGLLLPAGSVPSRA